MRARTATKTLRPVERHERTEKGPDGIFLMMRENDQIRNLTLVLNKANLEAYLMVLRILKVDSQ